MPLQVKAYKHEYHKQKYKNTTIPIINPLKLKKYLMK